MKYEIQLVPSPLWAKNCRSAFTKDQWNTIRHKVYAECSHKCAICGDKGLLHCHEVFKYIEHDNNKTGEQVLTGLIAVCVPCHNVFHIGRTMAVAPDKGRSSILRLMSRNRLNDYQARHLINSLMIDHKRRSAKGWTYDYSYAAKYL